MVEIIEILRQEHRNLEKLLFVMEQELSVFDRGERPDYEVFGAIIEFFKKYPDSCHHPKEDIIYEKFKARDPDRAASISDLEAEHREGAVRLRRVAQAIEDVLNDQEVLREGVDRIVRDFIDNERKHIAFRRTGGFSGDSRHITTQRLGRRRVDTGRSVRSAVNSRF